MNQQDLRRFLRLVTSQCSISPGGFERKIIIQTTSDTSKLPVEHTCTHTVDMPDYNDEALMAQKLGIAIENVDGSGFDYV